MPELPEVETIKNGLLCLKGQTISQIIIKSPHCLRPHPDRFSQFRPRQVKNITRRGKLLIFVLERNLFLIFHLKMTGKLFLNPPSPYPKHTHLIFKFAQGQTLIFQDTRKFGFVCLFTSQELKTWPFWKDLGKDPLRIAWEDFKKLFTSQAQVKSLLLNQKILAGIGNIYADESLFLAGIHPQTKANQIPAAKLKKLYTALQKVLQKAIQLGGSSFRDYVDSLGQKGKFQEQFWVYGRYGKPCLQCQTTLEKIKVCGRTSTICPQCQRLYL